MRTHIRWVLAMVPIAVATAPAAAQTVLFTASQGNVAVTLNAGDALTLGYGSPFTVSQTGSLEAVELYLSNNNAQSTVFCEVWSGDAAPVAPVAASAAVLAPVVNSRPVTLVFDGTLMLQPGQGYWLIVRSPAGSNNFYRRSSGGALGALRTTGWAALPSSVSGLAFRVLGPGASGACCNPTTGACATLSPAECVGFGATYRGDGALCAVPLCFPVGACCRSAACTVTTNAGCLTTQPGQPPGRWLGAGSACSPAGSPNACCAGDINGSGGRDVSDIFAFLSAWFAGCP